MIIISAAVLLRPPNTLKSLLGKYVIQANTESASRVTAVQGPHSTQLSVCVKGNVFGLALRSQARTYLINKIDRTV